MTNRLNVLEQSKPTAWQPPVILFWPDDTEMQSACQQSIDECNATGQMVIVVHRAGSEQEATP